MYAETYQFDQYGEKFGVKLNGIPVEVGVYIDKNGKEVDGGPVLFSSRLEAACFASEINDGYA